MRGIREIVGCAPSEMGDDERVAFAWGECQRVATLLASVSSKKERKASGVKLEKAKKEEKVKNLLALTGLSPEELLSSLNQIEAAKEGKSG
jgi:hypothetical protein